MQIKTMTLRGQDAAGLMLGEIVETVAGPGIVDSISADSDGVIEAILDPVKQSNLDNYLGIGHQSSEGLQADTHPFEELQKNYRTFISIVFSKLFRLFRAEKICKFLLRISQAFKKSGI